MSYAQGGTVRLDVSDFGNNWNPNNVNGNNDDLSKARRALIPQFFNFDTKGVPQAESQLGGVGRGDHRQPDHE